MLKQFEKSNYYKHKTKRKVVKKFIFLLLIFLAYFLFVAFRYGIKQGLYIAFLTWSFFVFCTPIADAGLLLDFPIRLLTKLRMIYAEIGVWIIAALLNLFTFLFNPQIYESTLLLMLFKQILTTPFPFWAIILVSGFGTFLSIYFADELVDVATQRERKKYKRHKKKYFYILIIFLIILILILYDFLLKKLNISIIRPWI